MKLRCPPGAAALALAAYLADHPVALTAGGDASLRTHSRLRCSSLKGDRVHRLDSARGLRFYTTACGLRVPKVAGVLVADDVDCQHYGCARRANGAAS